MSVAQATAMHMPVPGVAPSADVPGHVISIGGSVTGDVAMGPIVKDSHDVTVNTITGTVLNVAPRPAIERLAAIPQPPRAMRRGFLDRADALAAVQTELVPGGGAWVRGTPGCGRSALLRQASNLARDPQLADGVAFVAGGRETPHLDDLLQSLFRRFYTSSVDVHVSPEAARTCLGNLRALFVLDDLPLSRADLLALVDSLSGGSILVAGAGEGPDSLLDLPLAGLPPGDGLALAAREAQLEAPTPEAAALLTRLCAALDGAPLPVLLMGRRLRGRSAQLAEIVAALEQRRGARARAVGAGAAAAGPEPLAVSVEVVLESLAPQQADALAALVRIGGFDADLPALTAVSELPAQILRPVLASLIELGLVVEQGGRYEVPSGSLRRELDLQLRPGEERARAAAFFSAAAELHAGDRAWLAAERFNSLAAARTLLATGRPTEAGALVKAFQPALVLGGAWGSWGEAIGLAERSARASGDPSLRAWALHERGTRAGLYGDVPAATIDLGEARRLRLDLGDQAGADATLHNMEQLGLLPPPPPPPSETGEGALEPPVPRVPAWLPIVAAIAAIAAIALALIRPAAAQSARFRVDASTGFAPLLVSFEAESLDGGGRLSYEWDFGDGTTDTSSGGRVSHSYRRPGSYDTTLVVGDGRGGRSAPFGVTIVVENRAPEVTIEQPGAGTPAVAGARLALRGRAVDPEDGALPPETLRWEIDLTDGSRARRLAALAGNDLTFVVPQPEPGDLPGSYLAIRLVAGDTSGGLGEAALELRPEMVALRLATEPPGLPLLVDGREVATPHIADRWPGARLTVEAPGQARRDGLGLVRDRWSDGGAPRHTVVVSGDVQALTAHYRPVRVGFAAPAYRAPEASGEVSVGVALDVPAVEPVMVGYALRGTDFGGSLTIPSGEAESSFSVPLLNDDRDGPDRRYVLELREPRGAELGPQATAELVVEDDDEAPAASLAQAAFEAGESDGRVTIAVVLSAPSGREVGVAYATADDTALAGRDYEAAGGRLTFGPGQTSASFDVLLRNDDVSEAPERLVVRLLEPEGLRLGGQAEAAVVIRDDDPVPAVAFESARQQAPEGAGTIGLVVRLSARSEQAVSVRYATADGSAVAGEHYRPVSGTLTFDPGADAGRIDVPLIDNPALNEDRVFRLRLSDPVSGALGRPAEATLVIRDDDLPVVDFSAAEYEATDQDRQAVITVVLDRPAPADVAVRVEMRAPEGPTISSAPADDVFFEPGQTAQDLPIRLGRLDNVPVGEALTLELALVEPRNAVLGPRSTAVLRIVRVDGAPPVIEAITFEPNPIVVDSTPVAVKVYALVFDESPLKVTLRYRMAPIDDVGEQPRWSEVAMGYSTEDQGPYGQPVYLARFDQGAPGGTLEFEVIATDAAGNERRRAGTVRVLVRSVD